MGKFTLTHEIDCDAETFWRVFFDREFNDALFKGALEFTEFKIIEQTEDDRELKRKVFGAPKVDMPGPVAKIFGDGLKYHEDGTFDKTAKVWRWKMTPNAMADKMKNEGTMRVEPAGPNKVRRVAEIIVEAKIFGLGGILESFAEKNLRAGWDDSARFMNQWLREHKAK